MKIRAFLATVSVFAALLPAVAFADSAIIRNPSNNHWYQRFDTSMGWHQAKAFCEKRGGYLATITSQTEQDFVWNNLASKTPAGNDGICWLGATDEKAEGVWRWITGESWSYTNWNTGEPNNSSIGVVGGRESYLHFYSTAQGTWNDISSFNNGLLWNGPTLYKISTICEWGGNVGSWNFYP